MCVQNLMEYINIVVFGKKNVTVTDDNQSWAYDKLTELFLSVLFPYSDNGEFFFSYF